MAEENVVEDGPRELPNPQTLENEISQIVGGLQRANQSQLEFPLEFLRSYRDAVDRLVNRLLAESEQDKSSLRDTGQSARMILSISKYEFHLLTEKCGEVLESTVLAMERIAKDQQDIAQLRMETRAKLKEMRAA